MIKEQSNKIHESVTTSAPTARSHIDSVENLIIISFYFSELRVSLKTQNYVQIIVTSDFFKKKNDNPYLRVRLVAVPTKRGPRQEWRQQPWWSVSLLSQKRRDAVTACDCYAAQSAQLLYEDVSHLSAVIKRCLPWKFISRIFGGAS